MKSRGQDFAKSVLSGKDKKELIEWAESEIKEYQRFIVIIKGKKIDDYIRERQK